MIGWTLIESILWVSAIAVISSISSTPSNLFTVQQQKVDYTRLRSLLEAGDFWRADQETYRIVGAINTQLKPGEEFPCKALQTLDQLWLEHSEGRFGFSVQQQIWSQVLAKSPKQPIGDKVYEFCTRVGWDNCGLPYNQFTFNSSAVEGHLPTTILPLAEAGYDPVQDVLISFPTGVKSTDVLFLGRNPGSYEGLGGTVDRWLGRIKVCDLRG